jgi:hypothetical protein
MVEAVVARMAEIRALWADRVVAVLGLFIPELRGLQTRAVAVAVVGLIPEVQAAMAGPV